MTIASRKRTTKKWAMTLTMKTTMMTSTSNR
jgi:hypothetical protein